MQGDRPAAASESERDTSVPRYSLASAQGFELAGQYAQAARVFLQAGHTASARDQHQDASMLFELALGSIGRVAASEARDRLEVDARVGLASALCAMRGYAESEVRVHIERCVALSEHLTDTPLRILCGLWSFYLRRSDRTGTTRLLPQLSRVFSRPHLLLEELVLNALLGAYAFFRTQFVAAERHLLRAWELYDKRDPAQQAALLLRHFGFDGSLYPPLFLAWMRLYQGRVRKCVGRNTSVALRPRVRPRNPRNSGCYVLACHRRGALRDST